MSSNILQTLTVEYIVTGQLDGVTPAPELAAPRNTFDSNQMYRPMASVENLGIIDPDFTSGGGATGIAPRLISPVYIQGPGNFAAGAEISVVDATGAAGIVQQKRIASPSGQGTFYRDGGIYLPQASALRVSGLTATPGNPIIVRASVFVLETATEVAQALEAICCFESSVLRSVIGSMGLDNTAGSVETIVGAQNAWVRIGTGNPGAHPLFMLDEADSEISLQPTVAPTAPTQEIRYEGDEPIQATMLASASMMNGTVLGVEAGLRILRNGIPLPHSGFATGVLGFPGTLSFAMDLNLDPGDTLAPEISNFTNATPMIVEHCRLGVVKTLR